MSVTILSFGNLSDGREAKLYTMKNEQGMSVAVTDFGAAIVQILVAGADGTYADVMLGGDSVSVYEADGNSMGATVGRVANRTAGAAFTLNGVSYKLTDNENGNNLHSGPDVYNKRLWDVETGEDETGSYVSFSLLSPHMDQGYPGNLKITITYTLTPDNALMLHYHGICDQDTVINMTNHSYFNLAGHNSGSVDDLVVWIDADQVTKTGDGNIPTGEYIDITGTPLDFRSPTKVGARITSDYEPLQKTNGYDHNYCLNGYGKEEGLFLAASCLDEKSGRLMEVYTDLPGLQLYSGNFLQKSFVGKGNYAYDNRCGICFESQYYPNAINTPSFVSPALKAGEEYDTTTVYAFSVK